MHICTVIKDTVQSQKVSTFLDNKLSALGIFVDLRKTFDTIDHGILF